MFGRAGLVLVAGALLLSGCIGASNVQPSALPPLGDVLKPAAESLWDNPQTAPHPAFNFPTLTNPATGPNIPALWAPIPAATMPEHITGLSPLAATNDQVPSGAGMSVFGSLAVVPGYTADTSILDITEPAKPKVLSTIAEERHRNVDFIAYPNGRLIAVFSTGNGTIPVWDITDPTMPVRISEFKPTSGTHKLNIVPGTPIVYNANSNGGGCPADDVPPNPASRFSGLACFMVGSRTPGEGRGITEIYDLTDPANPLLVQDWKNGFGCHHIYFWNSLEKQRAICAGIEYTQIWDTADPRNPTVVASVPMQHGNTQLPSGHLGLLSFSHFSILNQRGDILIVGDESGGGGAPPGCIGHGTTPAGDVSTPWGAIWFYDVKDETNPKLLGWFSPGHPVAENMPSEPFEAVFYSCTAHHGRLVPAGDRELLAMAFYRAGVVLVDFTDPSMPFEVAQYVDGSNTWEVQYYNGYLFTGDMNRGMDVLTFT